uniref:Uncharacterized protein n=1 Tax=Arundo donax TaxID=35708 RepID=A0A0A9FNK2_ARUDO
MVRVYCEGELTARVVVAERSRAQVSVQCVWWRGGRGEGSTGGARACVASRAGLGHVSTERSRLA